MAILAVGKARSRREPNLGCRGLTDLGDAMFGQKGLHESCTMGRRIVVMKLICSLGHCQCDGHTVHKLSQRCLTADWLAPRESDCSRAHSKASSDWLPSYIKATRPVLEIFKMAWYFPDRPPTANCRDRSAYELVCSVQKHGCCLYGNSCEYGEGAKVTKTKFSQFYHASWCHHVFIYPT